jgi:hypothetical protein
MRRGNQHARAGPKREGRPLAGSAPSTSTAHDDNPKIENLNIDVIVITEPDSGAFIVDVAGEGCREFRSHKAAYGFASGRRMTTGQLIDDRTGAARE